ncbi:MAG TPA: hypothetical protein VGD52_22780 [Pseudoduganella sp.]
MDYEARIAKAEAMIETNRQEIDRLYTAISELRKLILERTDRLEDGLKEVRREAGINQRWMIGLTLVNTTMILGLGGKLFGLY